MCTGFPRRNIKSECEISQFFLLMTCWNDRILDTLG